MNDVEFDPSDFMIRVGVLGVSVGQAIRSPQGAGVVQAVSESAAPSIGAPFGQGLEKG